MTTLQIIEGAPDERPTPALGLEPPAAAIYIEEVIWARIESWIAWRWGLRPCTFIVEGGCTWRPPRVPFVVETIEAWNGADWSTVALPPTPLGGYELGAAEAYRFTGMLGSDDELPEDVAEAYRRLAEYSAASPGVAGSSSYSVELGELKKSVNRAPNWLAKAMANSGAADLLRPWRRAP